MDSKGRTDSCSFTVAVTLAAAAPHIAATRFVAFGDSITEGKLGPAGFTPDPRFPNSYAGFLYNSLVQRYTAQTIDMYDDGFGGEKVQPEGVLRLPGVLNNRTPQVLLLQEGANDVNLLGDAAIPGLINGLRAMIREARGRGIIVFLATLLPQRPGGRNALAPASIVPANAQIRALAATDGAILVDLWAAFGGTPDPLIDADGLHATAVGYQRIASTFFTAIQSRLELSSMTSSIDRRWP